MLSHPNKTFNYKIVKNYDLCINSDTFGVEKAADMICEIAMKK